MFLEHSAVPETGDGRQNRSRAEDTAADLVRRGGPSGDTQ